MTRRAAKVDDNQPEVVKALRKAGISVVPTHAMGAGFPDLVCGYKRETYLLEIKDGAKAPSDRKLTPQQVEFIAGWRGSPVHVVTSVSQALAVFMEARE